jgi:CheY-like chemotaxis protein
MLNILIVEDEPLLATTLKHLIELNPRYAVTAIADDLVTTLAAIEERRPDIALVDLQLANGASGYSVAARLHDMGVACLFTSGKAPDFPIPDLAIGCLRKPFAEDDLVRALSAAEDILRGRERFILSPRLPERLEIYAGRQAAVPVKEAANEEEAPWVPEVREAKGGFRSRLSHWFAAS